LTDDPAKSRIFPPSLHHENASGLTESVFGRPALRGLSSGLLVSAGESFPHRFGEYLITAPLGEDALGKVFRALRASGEKGFVRLRILESSEISEDAVLDTIEEYGEIHSFLKNPAIARGVEMSAVEGVPFIAWSEESGRTLDALFAKVRQLNERVPIEHALFIVEKIAAALDHAYNTTVDGERTLHGLLWPGFVSLSDDGEARLAGFGLAPAFYSAFEKPRLVKEITPYLAPGERSGKRIGQRSDIFSVGVILFELLTGRLPSPSDPLEDVSALARQKASLLPPEAVTLLRRSLAPAQSRFPTPGEQRRELGRLLFSGPYSSSTFDLALFLSHLFRAEIEEETLARAQEASLDAGAVIRPLPSGGTRGVSPRLTSVSADAARHSSRSERPEGRGEGFARARSSSRGAAPVPPRRPAPSRRPAAFAGAALLAAAIAGGILIVSRRPTRPAPVPVPLSTPTAPSLPTATPQPVSVAAPPTIGVPESVFKEEVSRRVADKLKKLEEELKESGEKTPAAAPRATRTPAAGQALPQTSPADAGEAKPTPPPTAPALPVEPSPGPEPTARPNRESSHQRH